MFRVTVLTCALYNPSLSVVHLFESLVFSVFIFYCIFILAFFWCVHFHEQRQGGKCLFEHMLESLLRAIQLSAAIPSAPADALGTEQLSVRPLVLPTFPLLLPVCHNQSIF